MRLVALQAFNYPPAVARKVGDAFEVDDEQHARLLTAGVRPKAAKADDAVEPRSRRRYQRRDLLAEGTEG